MDGQDLVEALKDANEKMLAGVKRKGENRESYFRAYAEFVEEWCRANIDSSLVCVSIPKVPASS